MAKSTLDEYGIRMTEGRETRATIDTETVKGLLLINGGGAVALLAFLSGLLIRPEFVALSKATIYAIFAFQCGLIFAVIHAERALLATIC